MNRKEKEALSPKSGRAATTPGSRSRGAGTSSSSPISPDALPKARRFGKLSIHGAKHCRLAFRGDQEG